MENCLQNFFEEHQRLLRKWDFCRAFLFLVRTTIKIRLIKCPLLNLELRLGGNNHLVCQKSTDSKILYKELS